MGKGAQQVAKRDETLSADDAWIEKMDLAGFRDEIRALGKELEAGQGPADAAHLRKLMMWTDTCGIVALATLWATPNPVTVIAMSTWIYTRWTMFGHHICHGGYDKLSKDKIVSSRFNRFKFAAGSLWRRFVDWWDWFLPEAWSVEHNQRHHYCLGEIEDPDLVEHNLTSVRDADQPRWQKYVTSFLLTLVWKWYYYAPNTYKELKLAALRRAGKPLPEGFNGSKPCVIEHFLYSQEQYPRIFTFKEFATRVIGPYFVGHFVVLPLVISAMADALGLATFRVAFARACVNLFLAELLTNFHAFATIATNHCGSDLYRFDCGCRFASGTFYLRQVISSADYNAGTDFIDYLHGWLNYQVEHHIWPNLSMLSYQRAHPRVKAICAKYGIPFTQENCFKRMDKTFKVMVGAESMRRYPMRYECKEDISSEIPADAHHHHH